MSSEGDKQDNDIRMNIMIAIGLMVLAMLVWKTIERELDEAAYEEAVSNQCIKNGGYPIVDARALSMVCLEVKYEANG